MRKLKIKTKPICLRMPLTIVAELDTLCKVNQRSRREVAGLLVRQAFAEYTDDPDTRISP